MTQVQTSDTGTVVAFKRSAWRVSRPLPTAEDRGALLLFTGVRYERMSEPEERAAAIGQDGVDDDASDDHG